MQPIILTNAESAEFRDMTKYSRESVCAWDASWFIVINKWLFIPIK